MDRKVSGFGLDRGFCEPSRIQCIESELDHILALRRMEQESSESNIEHQVSRYGEGWIFQENLWKESNALKRWLLEGEPAQLVAKLTGSAEAWLIRDQTYFKLPGSEHTPWHQDALFIPIENCETLTLWIPLTSLRSAKDSPLIYWKEPAEACHFIEQMNQLALHNLQRQNWLEHGWKQVTTINLELGDCAHHRGWTVHGSDPLTGSMARKAYVVVYGLGEGNISVTPPMSACPNGLRNQAWMLRRGLQQICFGGLPDGTPVPTHHNPWILVDSSATYP